MHIREIMTRDVITVLPDTSLKEIGKIFKEKRISGVPVVESDGSLIGIVTLTDLLRVLDQAYKWKEFEKRIPGLKISQVREEEKSKAKARDIMTKDAFTISEDGTIDDLMRIMFTKGIHTIPVIKDGRIVGIVGKRDLINICF